MAPWRIITGDCIEVLQGMELGWAQLVFADPPYNIGVEYGDHYHDRWPEPEFRAWCRQWLAAVHPFWPTTARCGGSSIAGGAWRLCADAVERIGFTDRQGLIWFEAFGVNCRR